MRPGVYNKGNGNLPSDAVLVDRTTIYGNPFIVGVHGEQGECVELHREWIYAPAQAWLRERIREELRGHDLICHCFPEPCHADTLIEIANEPAPVSA